MKKSNIHRINCLLSASLLFIGVPRASANTLEFGDPDGFFANFRTNYTGTPIGTSSTGGLNNSSAVHVAAGGGTQAWFSDAYFEPLAVGQSLSLSTFFQFQTNSINSGIKLGFSTDPNATANLVAMPNTGNWAYFGWFRTSGGSAGAEVYGKIGQSPEYLATAGSYNGNFVNGNWYQQSFSLEKTAAGVFSISWAVNNSSDQGVLGSALISGTAHNVSLPTLDGTNLYIYLGLEGASATGAVKYIDGLTMESDAPVVIPELSSPGLLLLCGLGVLLTRRIRRIRQ